MGRTKTYLEKRNTLGIAPKQNLTLPDAVKKLKAVAGEWESVDLAVRLGVDPRKADQNVRGTIILPHGTGRSPRVAVFTKGEKETEAKEAGADLVGLEDLIEQVQKGVIDFDIAIATPDVMKDVSKVAKVLGPRGLMPNPKSGTTTPDVANAIREFKAGKVNFRVEKAGIIHATVGKGAFNEEQLRENIEYLLTEIQRLKPASAKGQYIRSIALSSTQSPGLRVDPQGF